VGTVLAALGGVARVGYVVRRNNRKASRIYEDLVTWVRDDQEKMRRKWRRWQRSKATEGSGRRA